MKTLKKFTLAQDSPSRLEASRLEPIVASSCDYFEVKYIYSFKGSPIFFNGS